jgi:pantoate--beta-alanine ligase
MIQDLNIPVEIQGVATVREVDGLAMSSRNSYLSADQRLLAPMLYQALCRLKDCILTQGANNAVALAEQAEILRAAGFSLEYFTICRSRDLLPATEQDQNLIILIAAKLGNTRLIDNIHFCRQAPDRIDVLVNI